MIRNRFKQKRETIDTTEKNTINFDWEAIKSEMISVYLIEYSNAHRTYTE